MKTSIVILTYNQLAYTQKCIESIRKYTQSGTYEIIVVDNNSTDGTVPWLRRQKDLSAIYNQENAGFPRGCNQGIEAAKGDSVLLLNNDTIVTANWLANLTKCLFGADDVGAVGAITNSCSNYQAIKVDYQNLEEMHEFARKHNRSNPVMWEERLKLVGFCMLIKKEVIDKIGLLDEIFTPGNFEDDDYSFRIRLAGYKLILCRDTFIHHFGGASFKQDNGRYAQLLNENRKKFLNKWGFDSPYSMMIRYDIMKLIDAAQGSGIRVLEIGCACGGTLLEIKNNYQNASLFGVELNPNAAAVANSFARVISANIEETELDFPEEFFDYIILADVLEHLQDPWKVLGKLKKHLRHGGRVLASIPNVMHFSVIRNMLNGNWTYEDAGILDKTHLRFFTLNEINKMFLEAGYIDLEYSMTAVKQSEEDEKFIKELCKLSGKKTAQQYSAYQYLVKASAPDNIYKKPTCEGDSMHIGSYVKMEQFVKKYLGQMQDKQIKILDVGSQDVNGSYRPLFDVKNWSYTGCDMVEGKNVDVVLKDVYNWAEFRADTFDVVVAGQVFEHVEYVWVTMLEIARVLKEGGLCCIIAPSAGVEHRYPVDCWRFYPDAFRALAKYARLEVLEVYTQWNDPGYADRSGFWRDSVLICRKPVLSDHDRDAFQKKLNLTRQIVEMDKDFENSLRDEKPIGMESWVLETIENICNDVNVEDNLQKLSKVEVETILKAVDHKEVDKVTLLNFLAVQFFNKKHYDSVIPLLQHALQYDQKNPDTLYNLATVLEQMNQKALALQYLQMIEEKDDGILSFIASITAELK